jgi:hypothetical protein
MALHFIRVTVAGTVYDLHVLPCYAPVDHRYSIVRSIIAKPSLNDKDGLEKLMIYLGHQRDDFVDFLLTFFGQGIEDARV